MWSRPDLKMRGKFAFQKNYWAAVAVSLIFAIAMGAFSGGSAAKGVRNNYNYNYSYNYNYEYGESLEDIQDYMDDIRGFSGFGVLTSIAGLMIMLILGVVGVVVKVFAVNPIEVGVNRFFMENRESKPGVASILYGFRNGRYGNVVLTLFLRGLFTGLWSLLFIIPGIIKSYEYRMIPYILSENPGISYKKAFEISKQMMDGQKMNTFILDLSFIGWIILSSFTCGLLGIFYVSPYMNATEAELYAVFRAHAFHTGTLTTYELPGYGTYYNQSY